MNRSSSAPPTGTRSGKDLIRIVSQNTRTIESQSRPRKRDIQTVHLQYAAMVIGYMYSLLIGWSDKFCDVLGLSEGIGRRIVQSYVWLAWAYYLKSRVYGVSVDVVELPLKMKSMFEQCSRNMRDSLIKESRRRGTMALSCGWSEYKKIQQVTDFIEHASSIVIQNIGKVIRKTAEITEQRYQLTQIIRDFSIPESFIQQLQQWTQEPPRQQPSFMEDVCNSAYNLVGVRDFLAHFGCDPRMYEHQGCQEIGQIMEIKLNTAVECVVQNGFLQLEDFYHTVKVDARYFSSDLFMLGVIYLMLTLIVALLNGTTKGLAKVCRRN